MVYKGLKINKSEEAKAVSLNLPISWKHSTELARFIKRKYTDKVLKELDLIIQKKLAVPYKRNDFDRGHKPGIGPGRYPVKTSQYFLKVLKHAIKNAEEKGFNTDELFIKTIIVSKGTTTWHRGRHRRRHLKRTHVEIILIEKPKSERLKNKTKISSDKSNKTKDKTNKAKNNTYNKSENKNKSEEKVKNIEETKEKIH